MKKLLIIPIFLLSLQLSAQTAALKLSLNLPDDHNYMLYLVKETDTVYASMVEYFDVVELDSLEAGWYRAYIHEDSASEFMARKAFLLETGKETTVDMDFYFSAETEEIVHEDMVQKTELQFGLGYFHSPWADKTAVIKDNFSASYSGNYWAAFSKHAGFLMGAGLSLSQHYFSKDTSLFQAIPFKKVFERYTAVNMTYEIKFRFSTGDQRSNDFNSQKFFVDLGAGYYLPLLFNHAAMYRGSKKVIERNIHQFKDFRAFVNIGFAPVTVFLEYRLSDYIRKDYPELPKYNVGIRLMIAG